ncbi:NACHT, LRR and PYD domains-containing 14-like, partial [Paramuricea clavata]
MEEVDAKSTATYKKQVDQVSKGTLPFWRLEDLGLMSTALYLSNPIFPLQTQFCFIHLTIQEFLAAKHVSETFTPPEIKKFISDHVKSGKWHLVLQFIAGLLESFKVTNDEVDQRFCIKFFFSIPLMKIILLTLMKIRAYGSKALQLPSRFCDSRIKRGWELASESLHLPVFIYHGSPISLLTFSKRDLQSVIFVFSYNLVNLDQLHLSPLDSIALANEEQGMPVPKLCCMGSSTGGPISQGMYNKCRSSKIRRYFGRKLLRGGSRYFRRSPNLMQNDTYSTVTDIEMRQVARNFFAFHQPLRASENGKFSCSVDGKIWKRVDEIESSYERQTDGKAEHRRQNLQFTTSGIHRCSWVGWSGIRTLSTPSLKNGTNDLYIDVVIHTERAQHKFSKQMKRHEIYDVYMEVPYTSICLERIDELFYPNRDTKGEFPRSILAIGRPGIGKSVLTEKILHDWANGVDKYYSDKIVFSFKFRWFNENINHLTNISLKTFLRFGTRLSEEKFESIYKEIAKEPQKAIFIFDGLDEYHSDPISCLDQSRIIPNDRNTGTSAINLFIKLVLGDLLKGATVVVTSRPTAGDFYSRLHFDRNVEIIGFTCDKIEEYVSRFCDNNNTSDHIKTKIWNQLLYKLYQTAIDHLEKHHHRNAGRNSTAHEALKQLQRLAFLGMESGQLVFNQTLFDEEMRKSGLLNSLSNPIFPLQTQFCFIHLTIQEFLAAKHVTETLAPAEIKKFISDHVGSGQWHLVLQFIAGLLERFGVKNGQITVKYHEVFIMKCLREVDDEEITKEVCEATAINDLVELHTHQTIYNLSPSCLLGLLRKRCLNKLDMRAQARGTVADEVDQLTLSSNHNRIYSHDISKLCEVLNNGHCPNLTHLNFRNNSIRDEGAMVLCDSLTKGLRKLNKLDVSVCELTDQCIPTLVEALQDERCQLTDLSLGNNTIDDKGACMLYEDALTNEHYYLRVSGMLPIYTGVIKVPDLTRMLVNLAHAEVFWGDTTEETRKYATFRKSNTGKSAQQRKAESPADAKSTTTYKKQVDQFFYTWRNDEYHVNCFIKHHHRNADRNSTAHEALKQLQRLAFLGMESGQLVFNETLFDEEMKKSGLLNSLSNPIFPLRTQFCFIHLTIQEFLAAKHVTETLAPAEIKKFISDHVESGQWHVVLQFIAGLLESLEVTNELYTHFYADNISPRDDIDQVYQSIDSHKISKLYRCDKGAFCITMVHVFVNGSMRMLFEDALANGHCKLTVLNLERCLLTGQCMPSLCKALQNERCQLTELSLEDNDIGDKGVCMLFEDALTKEHCKLTALNLHECSLTDECIPSLCKALQDEHCKLTELSLITNKSVTENGKKLLRDTMDYESCSSISLPQQFRFLSDFAFGNQTRKINRTRAPRRVVERAW